MIPKHLLPILILTFLVFSCSSSVEFSDEFKKNNSGKYLYDAENLIDVTFNNNTLYLEWKGGKIKPVVLAENEFFVPDMYRKLCFAKYPKTKERYLATIVEDKADSLTYDYIKVSENYKTPSMNLAEGNYAEALKGYLSIKEKDSTSDYINEWDFNRKGYSFLRDDNTDDAIEVFKLNTVLHPNSSNVYNSLAEAYLIKGDSVLTYINYEKAYQLNPRDRAAKRFLSIYTPETDSTIE